MQLLIDFYDGEIGKSNNREYGISEIIQNKTSSLFKKVSNKTQVWMSHGDHLDKVPNGFEIIAHSIDKIPAAISSNDKLKYGIQFHPEV